jgi:hypothetical protein
VRGRDLQARKIILWDSIDQNNIASPSVIFEMEDV